MPRKIGVRALDLGFCQIGELLVASSKALPRIGIRPQFRSSRQRMGKRGQAPTARYRHGI